MAILNLENLVINKNVIGISCNACSATLNPIVKTSITGKILMLFTLGAIKSKHYQCAGCKKTYALI